MRHLKYCDIAPCGNNYLAQKIQRHNNMVYVTTPTGEGYVWKYPPQFDRLTARAMLIVKIFEPESVKGKFYTPHHLRLDGVSRIFSGVVAQGYAVLGSDGRVRLTAAGEGFFRWRST